mgnify:CR=1 FL=1
MSPSKLLVISALLLTGCGSPSEEAPVTKNAPAVSSVATPPEAPAIETPATLDEAAYKIVMLGDSLTAGYGLSPSDALPEQIEYILLGDGLDVDLVNAGVSGDTSAGGLARYDWSVTSADPDLLVVALGANDYLGGVDPARTRANLSAIIERAQADDLPVLLVSVSARSNAADDPRAAEFAAIYPELAQTYGVDLYEGLVDDVQDRPDLLQPDGLHPTAEGVIVIATPLAAAIARLVSIDEAAQKDSR